MSVTIRNVRTICCAPEKINLVTVKIETSEPELYGLGCATFAHRYQAVVTAIEQYLKPFLIGKDVSRIEDLWQTMTGMSYWRNGPVLNNAIAGVDMALWDIKGKMAGMPLYELFGGKCREAVPCYTHAEGDTIEETVERVGMLRDAGYRHIRAQVGGYGGRELSQETPERMKENGWDGAFYDPKRYMQRTVQLFEKLRGVYGEELELCHDVHERIAPIDAPGFAKEMERFGLFFLEDILPPEQIGWFHNVRQQSAVRLAMGELFNNPNEWMPLIENRLIDYIRVHLSQIGGITPARRLIALCDAFGVRTAWHGPVDMTPVGHAANAHLDISSPNFGIQEWTDSEHGFYKDRNYALMQEIFPGMPEVRNGYIYLSKKPGIGVDIDERAAEKAPCTDGIVTWDWMIPKLPDGTAVRP